MANKFVPTKIGKFDVFHGSQPHTRKTWYVYDTKGDGYTGGSFPTKKDAVKYAKKNQ